jgi:lysophospholipase L1-like esterase
LALVLPASLSAAQRLRTEDSAVTPVYASWHRKDNDRSMADLKKRNGDVGLLLVGDSITALWPTKGPKSYSTFLPWKPLNVAISAEHTEHVLYRLLNGNIEGIKPKAAMVLLGTNNLGHEPNEKPEWAAAGVRQVIDTLRTKLPGTKILLLALFPRGGERKGPDGTYKNTKPTDSIRQRTGSTNRLLAQIADNKMVFFMDIGGLYVDAEGNIRTDLMPDNLHPYEAGYQLWLNAVKSRLEELMK